MFALSTLFDHTKELSKALVRCPSRSLVKARVGTSHSFHELSSFHAIRLDRQSEIEKKRVSSRGLLTYSIFMEKRENSLFFVSMCLCVSVSLCVTK